MNSCFSDITNWAIPYFPNNIFNFANSFNEPFSLFGFNLYFEDILIIALAFFLFLQEDCDFLLVGVLVLILLG